MHAPILSILVAFLGALSPTGNANSPNANSLARFAAMPSVQGGAQTAPAIDDAHAFFTGKHAVVSGADGGIGAALVEVLLERGATVYAGSRRPQPSAALRQLQQKYGKALCVLSLDVTRPQSIAAFRQKLQAPRVDLLFNAAGVNIDGRARLLDAPDKRLEDTLAVNLVGPVRLTQALGTLLHNCGSPVVANLSSVMGSITDNRIGGSPSYRISKAAINMFTKELAIEEPALIALALHPGWVQTKMGGENADVAPRVAAEGLLAVVARAKQQDSGSYFRYTGERIPW